MQNRPGAGGLVTRCRVFDIGLLRWQVLKDFFTNAHTESRGKWEQVDPRDIVEGFRPRSHIKDSWCFNILPASNTQKDSTFTRILVVHVVQVSC